ncbi:hypothetical protein PACTADRAFT_51776 [Pachysolen tannophilus NRRL Y-2460]|uniref:Clathrin light chain n=1 Tax=Pachysolen tannophilus NRRL Y-2460 TaxID=669874 RepID=A0A1E4TN42_PACTA|nr:hypothetical protein PACTADRAFT_51776 [Pachysolen tannophilus NRRL Y-2460]
MSEKFPALQGVGDENLDQEDSTQSDFLSREKQLLGDEFATDKDADLIKQAQDDEEEDDEEVRNFENQFPDVNGENQHAEAEQDDDEYDDFKGEKGAESNTFQHSSQILNKEDSIPLKEWKERRDLEISKRDEIAKAKAADIKKKAQQGIDDFYESYNNKKQVGIENTRKRETEFLEKRDKFIEKGTIWSRSVELLELKSDKKDDDRFKQLLLKLSKDENAPGAAGYQ